MIEITTWINDFMQALDQTFGERVWFVGLQGSYARSEATQTSDIDPVVILDELSTADLSAYRAMLNTLPHRELICGFLSGKKEILSWETGDLFQFYHDTKPLKGSLDALLPLIDETSVSRAIKIGACNIYHGVVHNMLHHRHEKTLRSLYKSASFVVQAICFQQTGNYFIQQQELSKHVMPDERVIVETFMALKNGGPVSFDEMSEILFTWSKKWIR